MGIASPFRTMSTATRLDPADTLSQLAGPAIILPVQFADNDSNQAEKRLMLAVLEEAVATFQRYADAKSRRGERLFREAQEWIDSTDTSWIFAFESLCHALGLDVDHLRGGLQRWKARRASGTAKVYRFRRVSGRRTSVVAPRSDTSMREGHRRAS
jgi:hypothetical protein